MPIARILLASTAAAILSGCAHLTGSDHEVVHVTVDGVVDPNAEQESKRLLLKAQQHLEAGFEEKAERELLKALDLNPELGPAYNNLGMIYFRRHQLYEAAQAFDQAKLFMPGSGLPHNNLGLTLQEAGRLDTAIVEFETAYAMEPYVAAFLGNLVKARREAGEQGEEIRLLLKEMLLMESRPEWVHWTRDELELMLPMETRPQGESISVEGDPASEVSDRELEAPDQLPELIEPAHSR